MSERGYAVITGGGSGIGAAMCKEMAKEGYDVAICDIVINDDTVQMAKDLSDEYGVKALPFKVDVSDYSSCKDMFEAVKKELGTKVAVLVNNAGIGSGGPFLEAKPDEITNVIKVDLTSVLFVTHVVLPQMVENHDGCIVNTSSCSAINGIDFGAIYCAAKGGVISVTKAMAKEFGRYHIRINAIAPGPTLTPMLPNPDPEFLKKCSLLGEVAYPEDQSQLLGYIVNARNLTGQILSCNGGMTI